MSNTKETWGYRKLRDGSWGASISGTRIGRKTRQPGRAIVVETKRGERQERVVSAVLAWRGSGVGTSATISLVPDESIERLAAERHKNIVARRNDAYRRELEQSGDQTRADRAASKILAHRLVFAGAFAVGDVIEGEPITALSKVSWEPFGGPERERTRRKSGAGR